MLTNGRWEYRAFTFELKPQAGPINGCPEGLRQTLRKNHDAEFRYVGLFNFAYHYRWMVTERTHGRAWRAEVFYYVRNDPNCYRGWQDPPGKDNCNEPRDHWSGHATIANNPPCSQSACYQNAWHGFSEAKHCMGIKSEFEC